MVTVSPRTQFVILTVPTAVLKANTSTAMGRCETFSIKHAPHSLKKKSQICFHFLYVEYIAYLQQFYLLVAFCNLET